MAAHRIPLTCLLAGALALAAAAQGGADPLVERPAGELLGRQPFGAWQATIPGLAEPGAVAVGPNGAIYVAESAANRVRVFDGEGRELLTLGATGSGPGELLDPRGLAVDSDGRIFVADSGNHRISVFAPDGRFERAFGRWGDGPGELNDPRGLALRAGELLVADARNHRVAIFGLDGEPRAALGGLGRGPGRFHRPLDVAVAGDVLLVADTDNHRVQKLGRDGRPLASWGDFGPHPGFFVQPTGVDHHDGRVYVADRDNHRVQVFDEDGALQYEWGVHALRPREADGKLHYPDQVAVSPFGTFVVLAESFENRCQIFRRVEPGMPPNGVLERFERDTSAHYGPNLGLSPPLLALCEPSTPGLGLYDLASGEPILVTQIRRHGRGFAELLRPVDAAVDVGRGLVHLADPGNRRIATYALQGRGGELRYDPSMLRLQRSVDLDALHAEGRTGLRWPIEPEALSTGPEGELLVCDVANRAVVELSHEFEVVRVHTGGERPFLRPVQAVRAGGRLLVVDQLDARVRVLDAGEPRRELFSLGGRGAGDGRLLRPYGVAVEPGGAIWVSDAARHDVQRFDGEGRFLARFGGEGIEPGRFYKPGALARAPGEGEGGVLYVLDFGNHRGQVLRPDGTHLSSFGARMFTRPSRAAAPGGSR